VQLEDGSVLVRRIIASDNSCLFNAVGYVTEGRRDRAAALRGVIAKTVAGDPCEWWSGGREGREGGRGEGREGGREGGGKGGREGCRGGRDLA
jgi:hypothetical protein